MSVPSPFVLTNATRFHPVNLRGHSRSPSRSPLRKSQFAARELDPLLSNLSPDSTLKALQATSTIGAEGKEQDALARSIAEASPAEREIGIRAAVAAQKLKQWHLEISQWPWPARRDRGWGAGFLPPHKTAGPAVMIENVPHLGFLPTIRVKEYQERIEDIRDGLEALELEDVKDHVFNAHVPQRSVSAPTAVQSSVDAQNTGYGRMRDFTALITATVIQALPQLASLTMLLDTWDVRLSILRQIPDITQSFRSTRAGVETAFSVVRNVETGPLVTMDEYQTTKQILGGKVASLGTKVDKLLDILEGQEDSLPKSWIDTLEKIETEYAAWVVEAEHIAIRNDLLSRALLEQPKLAQDQKQDSPVIDTGLTTSTQATTNEGGENDKTPVATAVNSSPFNWATPTIQAPEDSSRTGEQSYKASPPSSRHNRGVSEISLAESAFSDISAAEIVDAQKTQVLASPRISVIDNPLRGNRDDLSWFSKPNLDVGFKPRPSMLQRASTASIEVVSRNSVKQVMLTRSRSHDLLGQISTSLPPPSGPSQALQQLSGDHPNQMPLPDALNFENGAMRDTENVTIHDSVPPSTASRSSSLRVEPLQIRNSYNGNLDSGCPELPRRSSKRLSQTLSLDTRQSPPLHEPEIDEQATPTAAEHPRNVQATPPMDESLEAKIKDILDTMPTRIRLAKDANDRIQQPSSTSSTRSSTPLPSLTLSPVKADRNSRQVAPGDVRLFHLTQSGQPRDTPPVKLFVRAVGEHGERVMVRVGGGWADLAEYLREYSLHHGHRGLTNGNLEVANFPTSQHAQREGSPAAGAAPSVMQPRTSAPSTPVSAKRRSLPSAAFSGDDANSLVIAKLRKGNRGKQAEGSSLSPSGNWTPPPVPPIPVTYTTQMPTTVTTTVDGVTSTTTIQPQDVSPRSNPSAVSSPIMMTKSADGRSLTTSTTTSSPSAAVSNYVPLGAAGPKSNGKRAASYNVSSAAERELWVEGMVGKARAVSGNTTTIQGPTTTTTTTVISRSTPTPTPSSTPKRISTLPNSSPAATPGTVSPESSGSKPSTSPSRPKSRLSFGDVSGIKRVFLRRKSDKGVGL